jgi:hypothetical protein
VDDAWSRARALIAHAIEVWDVACATRNGVLMVRTVAREAVARSRNERHVAHLRRMIRERHAAVAAYR